MLSLKSEQRGPRAIREVSGVGTLEVVPERAES